MYSKFVQAVEEYAQRLKDRKVRLAQRERIHIRLGNVRLVLAFVAAGVAWECFKQHLFSPWWMLLPLIAFIGVAASACTMIITTLGCLS